MFFFTDSLLLLFFALDFQFRSQSTTLNRQTIEKYCNVHYANRTAQPRKRWRETCIWRSHAHCKVYTVENQCQIIVNKKFRTHNHSWKTRQKIQIKQNTFSCYRLRFFLVENRIYFAFICLVKVPNLSLYCFFVVANKLKLI